MMFDVRTADLERLNSMTKYPSIPTYHALDPKNGKLLETCTPPPGEVVVTEKIDGTNARVVCLPDGSYVIGSRGEFLLARGDLIGNPALGIVEALRGTAERLIEGKQGPGAVVYFGEVYGGVVTQASKQYTGEKRVGFRLFDVVRIPDLDERLNLTPAELSEWREAGGQSFLDEPALQREAERLGLELTPRMGEAAELPTTLAGAAAFLDGVIQRTLAPLDGKAGGEAEGVVVRTKDRSWIVKLRFADYRRSLKGKR